MNIQLSSIEQMPRQTPIWQLMMDDLCQPPPERVAKALGLSVRTVQRYNATGQAPKHVCLAIFWLTRWGRSQAHTKAENDAQLLGQVVRSLRDQVEQMQLHVEHLTRIGNFGSANDPGDPGQRPKLKPLQWQLR